VDQPFRPVHRGQDAVQLKITRARCQVALDKVRRLDRRQDSRKDNVGTELFGGRADDPDHFRDLILKTPKTVAGEIERREVGLKVEATDLRRQPLVLGIAEDLDRDRRRVHRRINEEHFLLGADTKGFILHVAAADHHLECLKVIENRASELPELSLVALSCDSFIAHG